MVYKQDPTYLWLKGNTYYFNRHIPFDIQPHYKSSRVVICLKTACRVRANKQLGLLHNGLRTTGCL